MKKMILICWIGALALTITGAVWAESGQGVEWTDVLTTDTDGSTLIGGFSVEATNGCAPSRRAYIAFLSPDGTEQWRTTIPPSDGVSNLEPQHVLTATVHDAAIDPQTGEIFTIAEVLTAWQGGSCAAGITTAIGTAVIQLAHDGTVLGDVFLGPRPTGPPADTFGCDERCAPDRLQQIVGRRITIEPTGQLRIAGRQRAPRDAKGARDAFVADLSPPLDTVSSPDLTFFTSGPGGVLDHFCNMWAESHLVSVTSLPKTTILGSYTNLAAVDDCILQIKYAGLGSVDQFDDYGIETKFHLPVSATRLRLVVDLTLPPYYLFGKVGLFLKDRTEARFVQVATLIPDSYNKIKARFPLDDPTPYIDAEGSLLMRVVFKYNTETPFYDDSVDIDQLEIEPY